MNPPTFCRGVETPRGIGNTVSTLWQAFVCQAPFDLKDFNDSISVPVSQPLAFCCDDKFHSPRMFQPDITCDRG